MKKKWSRESSLRIFATTMLVSIFILLISMLCLVACDRVREQIVASEGYLKDSNYDNDFKQSISLEGEWAVFYDKLAVDIDCEPDEFVDFPISTLEQAKKSATYRMRFELPENFNKELFLHISSLDENVKIYVNGKHQNHLLKVENGNLVIKENMIKLSDIDKSLEYQEILIQGDFEHLDRTLHKRPVYIGTENKISNLIAFNYAMEMFVLGIFIMILISGFVFMILMPGHRVLSLTTLLDMAIMIRIIFSMKYVLTFMSNLFPGFILKDYINYSSEVFFLMIGGLIGCYLASALFDPEKNAPRWLVRPMPYFYIAFAIIFTIAPLFFEKSGIIILAVIFVMTFIGVANQFGICWKKKESERVYFVFQFLKTLYFGLLVLFELIFWNRYYNYMLLIHLYIIFFIMQTMIRIYDNNQIYRRVEFLNKNLEVTVKKRTLALQEANSVLTELSIRDALTHVFNRLYFERKLESGFTEAESNNSSLHLCIFDLDNFKIVNDKYGHDVGDEHLIALAKIVTEVIKDEAVFARIGGEEFILLFHDKTDEKVLDLISEVHQAILKLSQEVEEYTTASFGVAQYKEGDTISSIFKKADTALYEAKASGRNRIVWD